MINKYMSIVRNKLYQGLRVFQPICHQKNFPKTEQSGMWSGVREAYKTNI